MSYDAMRDAVRGRFAASGWTSVAIRWDGFNLKSEADNVAGRYLRPRIDGGQGDHVAIGSNRTRRRHFYVLVTDYSAPTGSGDSTAATDVQAVLDRFDRWESAAAGASRVVFHEPGFVREIGSAEEDPDRHLWRIFQPFYHEETL